MACLWDFDCGAKMFKLATVVEGKVCQSVWDERVNFVNCSGNGIYKPYRRYYEVKIFNLNISCWILSVINWRAVWKAKHDHLLGWNV